MVLQLSSNYQPTGQGDIRRCSFAQILKVKSQLGQASKAHCTLISRASVSPSHAVSTLTESRDKRLHKDSFETSQQIGTFIPAPHLPCQPGPPCVK